MRNKDFGPHDHFVELLAYTPNALELLIFTKNTRLQGGETLQDIIAWPEWKKMEHLDYMRGTIKSSWEFVDYTFRIRGVTRAFTHQLVRTRTGSYAQEAMRVTAPQDGVAIPAGLTPEMADEFQHLADMTMGGYDKLLALGVAPQDARGLLPTNIKTGIIAKFNLRTLHETGNLRLCTRTQGEYQNVFRDMRDLVLKVHPWAEDFINVFCVNYGQCVFPHYKDCPIKQNFPQLQPSHERDLLRLEIKDFWENERYESAPAIAKGAKSK